MWIWIPPTFADFILLMMAAYATAAIAQAIIGRPG